jgi:hypothetical protein
MSELREPQTIPHQHPTVIAAGLTPTAEEI